MFAWKISEATHGGNIGIVSDTHDNLPAIEKMVRIFDMHGAGLVIHAGDRNAPFSPVIHGKEEPVVVALAKGELYDVVIRVMPIRKISRQIRENPAVPYSKEDDCPSKPGG